MEPVWYVTLSLRLQHGDVRAVRFVFRLLNVWERQMSPALSFFLFQLAVYIKFQRNEHEKKSDCSVLQCKFDTVSSDMTF